MDWAQIISILCEMLIIPLVTYGLTKLSSFLKQKSDNETTKKYIEFATDAVDTAVKETMQTYVSAIKAAGTWNEDTAQMAFDLAKTSALMSMGKATQEAIAELSGDLDSWIDAKIEASLYTLKEAQK